MAKKDETPKDENQAAVEEPGETAADMTKKDETPKDETQAAVEEPDETIAEVLIVTTMRDGFRRGGRAWYGTIEVLASEFTPEQLEQIMAERLLSVKVKA